MTQEQEDRAYAVAVAKKQRQLDEPAAETLVASLPRETREALVAAGREGRVEDCRALLADVPAPKKKGKKDEDPPAE